MSVKRTLPLRERPTIGAWCFLDRFGPQATRMRVEPHPHTGLQTVTWPLQGDVRHRDSVGSDVVLRPGQLNLMTSGRGIAHSEYSLGEEKVMLDALQLWVALPAAARGIDPGFESHPALPEATLGDSRATVVLGELAGTRSPATAHTPIVGAQLELPAGGAAKVPLEPDWEHGIVLLDGDVSVDAAPALERDALRYLEPGRADVTLTSVTGATVFLLGGEPYPDPLVMWWNFVGSDHDEIAQARADWEARGERFGPVAGHGDVRIPAPALPTVRLLPRTRR
jgi:redox-sensitive bicupin YhaK (pirin superfamily)